MPLVLLVFAACSNDDKSPAELGAAARMQLPDGWRWAPGHARAARTIAERIEGGWRLKIQVVNPDVQGVEVHGPAPDFALLATIPPTPSLRDEGVVQELRDATFSGASTEVYVLCRYAGEDLAVAQALFR